MEKCTDYRNLQQPFFEGKTETMNKAYEMFMTHIAELADIGHAQNLIGWDQETYMPPRGVAMRARAQGTLAGLYHQRLTAPELVALVEDLQLSLIHI